MYRDDEVQALAQVLLNSTDERAVADARERLVHLHLNVAKALARRYRNRGIDAEDLEQVACLELVAVSRSYHPGKGESFLAYAVPCIQGALRRHFRDRGWTVRPPRRIQELQYDVRRSVEELHHQLGRSPRPSEIAAHLEVAIDDVREALALGGCFTPTSLDRPLTSDGEATAATLLDILPAARDDFSAADARALLRPVIRRLGDRDRKILRLRFFEQRTQQEIAADIGVTQMQVSRLLSRIMRDLREELNAPPRPPDEQRDPPKGRVRARAVADAGRAGR